MVARNWIGGGNNNANNPNDWSPVGVPTPGSGDILSLKIDAATMNVVGSDISSDPLTVTGYNDVVNFSNANGVSLTFNNANSGPSSTKGDPTMFGDPKPTASLTSLARLSYRTTACRATEQSI